MKKIRDDTRQEKEKEKADFLRQSPAQTSGGSAATPVQHAAVIAAPRSGLRPPPQAPAANDIVPVEILLSWGN
jgi:hypothetical protein